MDLKDVIQMNGKSSIYNTIVSQHNTFSTKNLDLKASDRFLDACGPFGPAVRNFSANINTQHEDHHALSLLLTIGAVTALGKLP